MKWKMRSKRIYVPIYVCWYLNCAFYVLRWEKRAFAERIQLIVVFSLLFFFRCSKFFQPNIPSCVFVCNSWRAKPCITTSTSKAQLYHRVKNYHFMQRFHFSAHFVHFFFSTRSCFCLNQKKMLGMVASFRAIQFEKCFNI